MELPQKLTSDLRIIQNQLKLALQTHQIMRIKQTNDPTNYKLHDDMREIEKKISSLGEKQNQLMRWLRKQFTSNSALTAKAIAATLGFAVNGSHQCSITPQQKSSNNILGPKTCNAAACTLICTPVCTPICTSVCTPVCTPVCTSVCTPVCTSVCTPVCSPVTDKLPSNTSKPIAVQKIMSEDGVKIEPKGKCLDSIPKIAKNMNQRYRGVQAYNKAMKQCIPTTSSSNKFYKLIENNKNLSEPLTAEKELFLSAVGLVTREILKELQNRRVERKRRSTANHTQFVYGSSWDISSKKRKKNNYLTSSVKQPVTRQAVRAQNHKTEPQTSIKIEQPVLIFKTPLPVPIQNPSLGMGLGNSSKVAIKSQTVVSSNGSCEDGHTSVAFKKKIQYNPALACFVCQEYDAGTVPCSCKMYYHPFCADKIENCVGCGMKIKDILGDPSTTKDKSRYNGRNFKEENKMCS